MKREKNSEALRSLWTGTTIPFNLGLDRKKGITPNEAILNKLRPGSLIGLFFRWADEKWLLKNIWSSYHAKITVYYTCNIFCRI